MGKKRQRKEVVVDPEEAAALDEEDEFAKELAAAQDIMREQQQQLMQLGDDGDSDAEEGVDASGPLKPREFINNANGLRQALEEIEAANGARPWPETMDVCSFPLDLADVHDDIQREVHSTGTATHASHRCLLLVACCRI